MFPLHYRAGPMNADGQLRRVSQFRYLGVEIHRDLKQYIPHNLSPVVNQLSQKCTTWKSLPLTPVGRVNLVKMSILPKFTYLFPQTPVPIPKSFFNKLDGIITSFVWNGKIPRIAKSTLQLPCTLGGLALPCLIKYYWVAVLVTVKWWLSEDPANPASSLEVAILGSYTKLRNLSHRGPRSNPKITLPMKTMLKVWDAVSKQLVRPDVGFPTTPLWGNPHLPHFRTIPDPVVWAKYGIITLGDIVSQGQLLSFDTPRENVAYRTICSLGFCN